ncbi:MAG: hypothetical protein HWN51_05400, partial [Desulfobacterales bacterium]|nr:hypothetical protein [Desulfobacterales bacterium]
MCLGRHFRISGSRAGGLSAAPLGGLGVLPLFQNIYQDVKGEKIMKGDVLAKTVLPQIEELVKRFDVFEKSKHYDDWSGISLPDASEFITAGLNAIHRAVGVTSPLARRIEADVKECSPYRLFAAVPHVGGALKALRNDIKSGYLVSVQELIHADI